MIRNVCSSVFSIYYLFHEHEPVTKIEVLVPLNRDNVSVVGSMMYGILMSVLAAALPITETFASQSSSQMFEVKTSITQKYIELKVFTLQMYGLMFSNSFDNYFL
jgi:multisubunit Na+/H+ antiporter MnhB subunit